VLTGIYIASRAELASARRAGGGPGRRLRAGTPAEGQGTG